jgi:hypothetical protein
MEYTRLEDAVAAVDVDQVAELGARYAAHPVLGH